MVYLGPWDWVGILTGVICVCVFVWAMLVFAWRGIAGLAGLVKQGIDRRRGGRLARPLRPTRPHPRRRDFKMQKNLTPRSRLAAQL